MTVEGRGWRALGMGFAASLLALSSVAPASAEQSAPPRVDKFHEVQSPDEIRERWTPEAIQEALDNPLDMGSIDLDEILQQYSEIESDASLSSRSRSVPQEVLAGEVPRASSTNAADEISVSQRVVDNTQMPEAAVGKVLIEALPGQGRASCSGAVIRTPNRNTVWTAAHCLHTGGSNGGWAHGVGFWPTARAGATAGVHVARTLYVPGAWSNFQNYGAGDFGAFVVTPDRRHESLHDAAVGALGYSFGYGPSHDNVTTYGYPEEGYHRDDLNGAYLQYCFGNARSPSWIPIDYRIEVKCDMGKGASGGPLLKNSEEYGNQIVGAVSHYDGTPGPGREGIELYSSEHEGLALDLIDEVIADYPGPP